jgi:hypothetical protein
MACNGTALLLLYFYRKPDPKLESSRTTDERKAKDDLWKRTLVEEAGKASKTWKEVTSTSSEQCVGAPLLKAYAPERSNGN